MAVAAPDGVPPTIVLTCLAALTLQAAACRPSGQVASDAATHGVDGPLADAPAAPDAGPPAPPPDAAAADASPRCGTGTCAPDEYCVATSGGPAPRCFDRLDGGSCPDGSVSGFCPTGRGACVEDRRSVPSCRRIPPDCTSSDPCVCLCGPPGGGSVCSRDGRAIYCGRP